MVFIESASAAVTRWNGWMLIDRVIVFLAYMLHRFYPHSPNSSICCINSEAPAPRWDQPFWADLREPSTTPFQQLRTPQPSLIITVLPSAPVRPSPFDCFVTSWSYPRLWQFYLETQRAVKSQNQSLFTTDDDAKWWAHSRFNGQKTPDELLHVAHTVVVVHRLEI